MDPGNLPGRSAPRRAVSLWLSAPNRMPWKHQRQPLTSCPAGQASAERAPQMPHRFRQASFAVSCVMASLAPGRFAPPPRRHHQRPAQCRACSAATPAPRASTPQVPPPWEAPACASRPAPLSAVWNTDVGTCSVTYSFSRSYTPAASGYHRSPNNFFGTLYMGGADFTGSFGCVSTAASRVSLGPVWRPAPPKRWPPRVERRLQRRFGQPKVRPACGLQLRVGEHADGASVRHRVLRRHGLCGGL